MEIVPGIHWIEGITGHCYIVVDKELTLIDTGMPHKTKKILRYITDELQSVAYMIYIAMSKKNCFQI